MFDRHFLIYLFLPLSFLILPVSVASAQDAPAPAATEAKTSEVKKKVKIKDRRHPDYIRCRKEPVIGSLSKKRKICMTNKEWKRHIREGNKRSDEFITDNRPGATSGQ